MNRLADILSEAAALMRQDGDHHWANWLLKDVADLRAGRIEGAAHFLSAFGGMGSLNDTYGRQGPSKKEEEKSVIEKICDRLDQAWHIADRLVRDSR